MQTIRKPNTNFVEANQKIDAGATLAEVTKYYGTRLQAAAQYAKRLSEI